MNLLKSEKDSAKAPVLATSTRVAASERTRRREYSIRLKRAICRLTEEHSNMSQSQLAVRIERELGVHVPQSTLSRIQRDRERWLGAGLLDRRRLRSGQHAELEDALIAWANHYIDNNGCLTYDIIVARAQQLGEQLGIRDFDYNQGWVYRFCTRASLTVRRRVGEAASANLASVELAHHAIPIVLAMLAARLEDVFNCDETGLVFGAQPCKTLAFGPVSGTKRAMDRVTVMFCCNSLGTEKLKPVIVAKPKRPGCFGELINGHRFDVERYMHYFNNQAAWMTQSIFNQWLARMQTILAATDRTIYLLLDNCSAHGVTMEHTVEDIHGLKVSQCVLHYDCHFALATVHCPLSQSF